MCIWALSPPTSKVGSQRESVANPQANRSREAGEYTDYEFVSQGQRFPVHKIIVCCQSEVFRKACNGPFKVRFRTHT